VWILEINEFIFIGNQRQRYEKIVRVTAVCSAGYRRPAASQNSGVYT
jgi:hypothetical protein